MKKIFKYLEINSYFLIFIFVISYLITIKGRIHNSHNISLIFTPEAPIASLISALFIFFLIKVTINYLNKKNNRLPIEIRSYIKSFTIALLLYIFISNLVGLIIALIFDTFDRNFTVKLIISNNLKTITDFIFFGSLYLSFLYSRENVRYKNLIIESNRALDLSKIKQLKTQLNPHFLFNNLNTLDELIEEDKHKASEFLNHFSELYRYALITSEKKLTYLHNELEFVESYFKLIEHKYQNYYRLSIDINMNISNYLVPPFCLQLLVENAIEHNIGSNEEPIYINIKVDDSITVSNNLFEKKHKKSTGGRALKNLTKQYQLLSGKRIDINKTKDTFTVILPLILEESNV